jgi:hemoglobin
MTQPFAHDPSGAARPTVHERIGSEPIGRMAELLYARIDQDPMIRGMFSADLGPESGAVRDMRQFLIQFFGGPADYSARKGHPRLRARHMGFPITVDARAAWLSHALAALAQTADEYAIDGVTHTEMREYFERASAFMINR